MPVVIRYHRLLTPDQYTHRGAKSKKTCSIEKEKWWAGDGEVELRECSREEIRIEGKIKRNFREIIETLEDFF